MSLIKEPKGVDFIIQSPPLTDEERKEISDYIKEVKQKNNILKERVTREVKKKKLDFNY